MDACPNTFIVSSRINWVPFMQTMIINTAGGKRLAADWTGTLAHALHQWLRYPQFVAET